MPEGGVRPPKYAGDLFDVSSALGPVVFFLIKELV